MRPLLYICNEAGIPVALTDRSTHEVLRWGKFMEKLENRLVKQSRGNGLLVSTIFMGIDSDFTGPPVLWETMVFNEIEDGGSFADLDMDRCAGGREQAEAMHEEMCRKHGVPPHF